ncbi:hypothetical protein H8L32_17680 [Undibacterium sp. CY18W]|uniref:Uncharacterized protein n=1 Tax=Undibacterium hunanense TaxID=2762292 RepID=A0ABR6ZTX9_9BURK|nr:hypothetical protein [Undibacterium hunanense]MBC3919325.1 hypothetical protein [Undibacterium hunanense]
MTNKTYSIFGAGAAGLYTAWRLLSGQTREHEHHKLLLKGDKLELFDWGKYDFSKEDHGSRAPGARVCTWHYQDDPGKSYVELGGMRYSEWNSKAKDANNGKAPGHRLVTTVIAKLGLDQYSVPFNESDNPLYYLRSENFYLQDVTSRNPAPYNANNYLASLSPNQGFTVVEDLAVTATTGPQTRREWDHFYQHGKITAELPESSIFQKGDKLKDIGYWNLMFDQLGSEGYNYAADGNGYTSNVINWNAAVAFQANNEFTPGNQYKTLTTGYSGMFKTLFETVKQLAKDKGVIFDYQPNRRLHSILDIDHVIHYNIANRDNPNKKSASGTTDAAWLAMPRYALELVAQATRYESHAGLDVLNAQKVQLYMEASIMQPSYKIGMFFKDPWWLTQASYAPQLTSYEVTKDVLLTLEKQQFPERYLLKIARPAVDAQAEIMNTPYSSAESLLKVVEQRLQERLTVPQEEQLLAASTRNTIGPSVTDNPVRMVVYFGNNATDKTAEPVYGLLAAYDDEMFTTFWQELELGPDEQRHIPISENTEPLKGPRKLPPRMLKMVRKQLANIHFGPNADFTAVPEPLDAAYIDWSLPPFNAGYHAWAAHYDIGDVQQKIRKPSQLIPGADTNIFIVGEAYSNDQAWVEGAYCTAESVLNDFFGVIPLIDNTHYPFICSGK